jgi:hypothetical protein
MDRNALLLELARAYAMAAADELWEQVTDPMDADEDAQPAPDDKHVMMQKFQS